VEELMTQTSKPTPAETEPPKSQRDRFIEAATQLGCEEDEEAFRAKLAVIAKQKPKPKN
jgi:hypothetical protein